MMTAVTKAEQEQRTLHCRGLLFSGRTVEEATKQAGVPKRVAQQQQRELKRLAKRIDIGAASFTAAEAAQILGTSPRRIRDHANQGTLQGRQFGRTWVIGADDLRAFAAKRRQRRGHPGAPKLVRAFGEAKTVADWAVDPRCKVGRHTLWARLKNDWEPERAIAEPSNRQDT